MSVIQQFVQGAGASNLSALWIELPAGSTKSCDVVLARSGPA